MNIVIFIAADVDSKMIRDAISSLLMDFETEQPISWTIKKNDIQAFTVNVVGKNPLVINCVKTMQDYQQLAASSFRVCATLCLGTLTEAMNQAVNKLARGAQDGVIYPIDNSLTLLQTLRTTLEGLVKKWVMQAASTPMLPKRNSKPEFFGAAVPVVFQDEPQQAELRAVLIGYITRQRNRLQEVALTEPYVCSPKDIILWAKCQLKFTTTKAFHSHLAAQVAAFQVNDPRLDLKPLTDTLGEMALSIDRLALEVQRLIPSGLMTSNPGSGREAMEATQLLLMKIALLEAILTVLYQPQAIIPLDQSTLGRCQQQVNKTIQQSTLYQIEKILKPEGALIQAYWESLGANLAKKMKPHFATYPQVVNEAEALQTLGIPPEMSPETHETWIESLLRDARAQEEVPLFTSQDDLHLRREPFAPTEVLQCILNKEESIFAILHEKRDKRSQGETRLITGFRFLDEMLLQKKLPCAQLPADYSPILPPDVVITKAMKMTVKAERKKYLALHHLSLVQHPQFEFALRAEALMVLSNQYLRYMGLDDDELIDLKKTSILRAQNAIEKPLPQFSIQALIHQMLTISDPTYGCLHDPRHHDDQKQPKIIVALLKLKAIYAKPGRLIINEQGNIEIAPPPPSLKAKMGGLFSPSEPVGTMEYYQVLDEDCTF